jgi:hypothetical protein
MILPPKTESRNDGVDGAPNGICVPRWSLSSTHLKGAVHGEVYPEFVDCHAGWSRSGEEGVSGSGSRREGRDRCGAQACASLGRLPTHGGNVGWTFLIRTPEPVENALRLFLDKALPSSAIQKKGLQLTGTSLTLNPDLVFATPSPLAM